MLHLGSLTSGQLLLMSQGIADKKIAEIRDKIALNPISQSIVDSLALLKPSTLR